MRAYVKLPVYSSLDKYLGDVHVPVKVLEFEDGFGGWMSADVHFEDGTAYPLTNAPVGDEL